MAINKQPIFTANPILYNNIYDPDIFDFLSPSIPTSSEYYYTKGITLIDRVTVQIPANVANPNWSSKSIYLILSNGTVFSIYQREEITGGTYVAGTNLPSVTWNFEGGLVLPTDIYIFVQASIDYNTNNYYGDYLSVTMEGGEYNI